MKTPAFLALYETFVRYESWAYPIGRSGSRTSFGSAHLAVYRGVRPILETHRKRFDVDSFSLGSGKITIPPQVYARRARKLQIFVPIGLAYMA